MSETKRRYGASRIPAGSTVEDWPFGYEELEPFYDKVEWSFGVSGQAGANKYEGPRTREYPVPPIPATRSAPATTRAIPAGLGAT